MGIHLFIEKEDHRGPSTKITPSILTRLLPPGSAGVNACGIAA